MNIYNLGIVLLDVDVYCVNTTVIYSLVIFTVIFMSIWLLKSSNNAILPRDAMLSTVYAVVVCLSVCLCVCVCVCVCVSVTLRYCIKTAKSRITQIMPHDSPVTLVF